MANTAEGSPTSVEESADQYSQMREEEVPVSLGFSARLNMLWDLAAVVPAQTDGRVIGVMGINREWRESDVRKWLQKDVLPPRLDLHNMVKFLVAQLEGNQDARRWEAFLVYGAPIVSSPVKGLMPLRALRAGFFTVVIFIIPGMVNSPIERFLMLRSIRVCISSMTEEICFLLRPVLSARLVTIWLLVILVLMAGAFFTGAAFLAAAFFLAGAFLAAAFFAGAFFLAAFLVAMLFSTFPNSEMKYASKPGPPALLKPPRQRCHKPRGNV